MLLDGADVPLVLAFGLGARWATGPRSEAVVSRQVHEPRVELDLPRRRWATTVAFWWSTRTSCGTPPNHSKLRINPSSGCSASAVSLPHKWKRRE
jgi:hypothetical protein